MSPDDRDDDTDVTLPPDPAAIPAGQARLAVSLSFAKVTAALLELESVATACARTLDLAATTKETTT